MSFNSIAKEAKIGTRTIFRHFKDQETLQENLDIKLGEEFSNAFAKINKEDILEYYAIRNILNHTDWLFTNHSKMINDLGGYKGQFSNKVYQYWIEGKNSNLDKEICDNLSDFIYKNQYKLTNLKT